MGVRVVGAKSLALGGGSKAVDSTLHRRWPEILPEDRQAITRVLDRNVLGGLNAPEVTALQQEYSKLIGSKHALALNSGTAALHCALVAAGVEPGDEVICPVYSFVASPMAIYHAGAVPVFVDIDRRTFNIDPALVEERITGRTKAIMVVHIHGLPADMDELLAIGRKHGLKIIEDYAETHATRYKGKCVGTLGFAGATSLNTSKNLSAGEGGLFITDDDDAIIAARRLCCFGEDLLPLEQRKFWSYGIGWNYRTTEIVAAFTREQLKRLLSYNSTAQANATILDRGLKEIKGLIPPYVPSDRECTYWKYMVQIDINSLGLKASALKPHQIRDRIVNALKAEGCEPMVWQPHPLAAQPVFRGKPRPWTRSHTRPDIALKPWDPAEYPIASEILDTSFTLAHDNFQLYIQSGQLMEQYVEAVHKVFSNLDFVLAHPLEDIVWPAHTPDYKAAAAIS
jgi:perosamine synthetase